MQAVDEVNIKGKFPDIFFKFGKESFIVQVKVGKHKKLLEGLIDAEEHAKLAKTNNFIVLRYPEEIRRHLASDKPKKQLEDIALTTPVEILVITKYWKDHLEKSTVEYLAGELLRRIKKKEVGAPTLDLVTKTLSESVDELSAILKTYSAKELNQMIEPVVGRFDLFLALGKFKDSMEEEKALKDAAINLTSYLLIDQILFYHIYHDVTHTLSALSEDIKDVYELNDYFKTIKQIDYLPIYSVDVVRSLPKDKRILEVVVDIIRAIKLIEPEHVKHALIGRLFHELLPEHTRKILAAFYTNPIASELLASLTIDSAEESIIDPACGSGTLLVSAYKRKMELSKVRTSKKRISCHKKFLEREITGLDVMPFATHLTAVNLSSQYMETTSDILRIGVSDSLLDVSGKVRRTEGYKVSSFVKRIQRTLGVQHHEVETVGAVGVSTVIKPFYVKKVDSLLMNPPFSDREKLPTDYRKRLNSLKKINEICGKQVNLWGLFLSLADEFMKDGSKIGAVLPINLMRGRASQKLRDFILQNYHIRYIVKSTKDVGFSEGCQFRDILVVLEKRKVKKDERTAIVFINKPLKELEVGDGFDLGDEIRSIKPGKEKITDRFEISWVKRGELEENRTNLMRYVSMNSVKSISTVTNFLKLVKSKSGDKLTKLKKSHIREGFHASPAGLSEVCFITNGFDSNRVKRAFLILDKVEKNTIRFHIKGRKQRTFKVPLKDTFPALRTLTGVDNMNINSVNDYIILKKFKNFETVLHLSKWKGRFDWNLVQKNKKGKETHIAIGRRFRPNSSQTHHICFVSPQKFICPHTFKILPESSFKEAQLVALSLNSIVNICNLTLNREQTTAGYTDVMEDDLLLFDVIAPTEKQKELWQLFKSVSIKFPSLMEQLSKPSGKRVEFDRNILSYLGLSKSEINYWLPKVYKILYSELKKHSDAD